MVAVRTLLDIYHVRAEGADGVIISSVVPDLTDLVREGMAVLTGVKPLVVGQGIKTGIRIATDHPASLGSDLVVDAVAAAEEYPGPAAVFDLGTATTCSVIDRKRAYLGTLIMPGIGISQEALSERAAQLPHIRFERPKHLIGKNTVESMQSGLVYGNAAMIDGLIERIEEELHEKVTAIATGGAAKRIVPHCRREIVCDPDAVEEMNEQLRNTYSSRAAQYGLELDDFLKMFLSTDAEGLRENAEELVKQEMTLNEIIRQENLAATDEQKEKLARMNYFESAQEMINLYGEEAADNVFRLGAAYFYLIDHAKTAEPEEAATTAVQP